MQDPLTGQVIPGSWRSDTFISALSPLEVPLFGHNVSTWAKKVRETFNDSSRSEEGRRPSERSEVYKFVAWGSREDR